MSLQFTQAQFIMNRFTPALFLLLISLALRAADSLPPLNGGKAPASLDELWGNYDPRKEPLETQVVREWAEGDITFRYVIFTIGTFKDVKARLSAFYAFPKADQKLPAILQVHGGGQSASLDSVRNAAANGYAGLSINWGGNKMKVGPLQDEDPNTDWGAVDATQKHNDHYGTLKPDAKTLDAIESPRNNNWFLLVLAARRGLTFLEQQPEVDASRLGVTGHSMGGKITTDVAGIDARVKAAVPSCGGAGTAAGKVSGMPGSGLKSEAENSVMANTIEDLPYIQRITCPILYMAPTDDFAGPFDNMTENWKKIGSRTVAATIAPHLNHRSIPETAIGGILWFNQHLKNSFVFPKNPVLTVQLQTASGVPHVIVQPDRPGEVVGVDIYYSVDPHCLTRFWRDAQAVKAGDQWVAECPVLSVDQPLFVYANVSYPLTVPCVADRGGKPPKNFILSTREAIHTSSELKSAGVKATGRPSRMIDDFARGWHDWYRLEWANPHVWSATTRKLKDPQWRGPEDARLVLEVKCPKENVLAVSAELNGWGAFPGKPGGTYTARKHLVDSPDWQTVSVSLEDMLPEKGGGPALKTWQTITEFSLRRSATYLENGQEVKLGDGGQGWNEPREFRNLRWEGGAESNVSGQVMTADAAPKNLDETIQKEIQKSIELEKQEKRLSQKTAAQP